MLLRANAKINFRNGGSAEDAVLHRLALVGFALMGMGTAFLLGPPLLGYIAEYFGISMLVSHRATAGYPEHPMCRGAGHQTAEARG
ncbi:MAG TPA: hypothetical protein VIS99_05640 [Terrimicrobiaceae bacterium]